MDSPILSPWVVYLMDVADSINTVLIIMIVICAIFFIGYVFWFVNELEGNDDAAAGRVWNKVKKTVLWSILPVTLYIVVPNQSTIIKMIIANFITPKNMELAVKTGVDLKDMLKEDFIDLIDAVQGGKETKKTEKATEETTEQK